MPVWHWIPPRMLFLSITWSGGGVLSAHVVNCQRNRGRTVRSKQGKENSPHWIIESSQFLLYFFCSRQESCKHTNTYNLWSFFQKIPTSPSREGTAAGLINLMWLWFNLIEYTTEGYWYSWIFGYSQVISYSGREVSSGPCTIIIVGAERFPWALVFKNLSVPVGLGRSQCLCLSRQNCQGSCARKLQVEMAVSVQ